MAKRNTTDFALGTDMTGAQKYRRRIAELFEDREYFAEIIFIPVIERQYHGMHRNMPSLFYCGNDIGKSYDMKPMLFEIRHLPSELIRSDGKEVSIQSDRVIHEYRNRMSQQCPLPQVHREIGE